MSQPPSPLFGQHVLVTGATGFLGGALALRLAADGAKVRGLARSPGKADFLREAGIEVAEGNVTDSMRRAAQGCQVIFHVAGALNGNYARQYAVNVEGTRKLLDASTQAERFVYVSSISAYGYNVRGDVTEETPLAPGADPYGTSKKHAETVVREGGVPYTIIRPAMIYGAGSVNWTGGLFRLAKLNPTPFLGSGRGSAFPIHIDDVVDMMVTAASHPGAVNQVFNCAPDPAPTWREFLGCYSRLAGHDHWLALPVLPMYGVAWIALLVSPKATMGRDLLDQVGFIQREVTYKMAKARALLGWQPRIDLDSGIQSCAPWLRQQGLL